MNSFKPNLLASYMATKCNSGESSNIDVAEENRSRIIAEHPWLEIDEVARAANKIYTMNASAQTKQAHLLRWMSKMADAIAPFVACRVGCAHCCHIPVAMSSIEADRIGVAIGRKLADVPKRDLEQTISSSKQFKGSACPFLEDSKCSIYEHRPGACRLHRSLDNTSAQCDLAVPEESSSVPSLAASAAIELPFFALMLEKGCLGDIREFFPIKNNSMAFQNKIVLEALKKLF